MRIHRFLSAIMAVVMATLFCLPMAHASEYGTQVVSAPMTYALNARSGMVRVYLSSMGSPTSLDITVSGSYTVSGGTNMALTNGEKVKVTFNTSTGQITLTRGGQSYAMGTEMAFRRHVTDGANGLKIAQARKPANLYPGDLRLVAQASGSGYRLYPIVNVYIESYLQGVVPYEMGDSAHIEALKAQAVAARTYTLGRMNARAGQLYDVVDTTNDQVYYGNSDSTANCTAAVNATKGIVLQNSGQLTSTYYTASNGGQTESAKNFFGTSSYPYLTVKDDPFDRMNPNSVVRSVTVYADNTSSGQNSALKDILHNKAVSALSAMGYSTSAVQVTRIGSITPHTPKFASPSRLYTKVDFGLTVSTGSGTVDLTVTCDIFNELESALGMSINSSQNELWSVERSGSNFVLKAARFGHGVGMSQRGAMQMGNLGYTYDQILGFYYENSQRVQYTFTHTILSAIGTGDETITGTDTPADITPSAGGYATVHLVGLNDQLAVRYTADTSGAVLTTVANGGMVSVLAKGDAWTLVRLGRIVGYVPTAYLQFSGDVPTSSGEQPTSISRWATVVASGTLNLRASGSMSASVLTQIPSGAILSVFSTSGSWAEVQYGALSGWASTDFLRFSDSYPGEIRVSGTTATVRTSSGGPVNLRQTASTSGGIVTTVAHGEAVQVVTNDGSWCQVVYNGQQGYIMASYLDFGDGQSGDAPTLVDPPATQEPPALEGNEQEAIVRTVSGSLNLRQQPSTQAMILAVIPRGESIVVTERGSEWSAVRFGAVSGYVMTQYLYFPADDSQTVTSYAIVTTQSSALNMRSQPQTASSIVTTMPRGARVGVIEWRGDGWARVKYEGSIGYASATYLTPEGQASTPGDGPAGTTATVNTASGALNLRQSPSTASTVLRTIPKGATVDLLQQGAEWCQVRYQGTSGYVATRYLAFGSTGNGGSNTPAPAQNATVTTSGGGLNLRETASTAARVLTSIPNGATVGVLERGDAWCRVQWGSQTGYVMTGYLTFASAPATRAAWIVANVVGGVNLRQSPSYQAAVITSLPSGTALTQTGTEGEWCAVTWNGQSGYILSSYLTYSEPAPAQTTMYVSAASGVNLRQAASTDAAILTGIPYGAAVTALGLTGEWRQVTYGGLQGYVMNQYLTNTPVQTVAVEAPIIVIETPEPESQAVTVEADPVFDPTLVEVPGWHAQIAASSLNVRQWCAADAPLMTSLPAGTTVDLMQVGDEWCYISYEGVDGYCMTKYLDLQPAMP